MMNNSLLACVERVSYNEGRRFYSNLMFVKIIYGIRALIMTSNARLKNNHYPFVRMKASY